MFRVNDPVTIYIMIVLCYDDPPNLKKAQILNRSFSDAQ